MLHTIRIGGPSMAPQGDEVLADINRLQLGPFVKVVVVKVCRIEGLTSLEAMRFAEAIKDVDESVLVDVPMDIDAQRVVEVAYKPGVMNPESASLMKVAHDIGLRGAVAADSSLEYHFFGEFDEQHVEHVLARLLVNATVSQVIDEPPRTLLAEDGRGEVRNVVLRDLDDEGLEALSQERSLFLSLPKMRAVQAHFASVGREPTDAEIEAVAQWWSEHCCHGTFKAPLIVDGSPKASLMSRLMKTASRFPLGVLSAFIDNSGVAHFYDGWAINGKVETHNSPSAAEPYGGAATGTGGVFRDILGTGEGAQLVASTDMFCFAPPTLADSDVPKGCLHPDYLLRNVVAGVRDYGNRMGVPTNNGSIHFHNDFRAKPTIIVGAYGIMPAWYAAQGAPQPGDAVLVVGGSTGRDGIHGATFSSGEMTDQTATVHASAVQIGNPIEEKRMHDLILQLRDRGFIRAITDCGAGGFSSAVGEMGSECGVHLWLDEAPLKYPGLHPWEILLSESQERMILAIRPGDVDAVTKLCAANNVEATVIGVFTDERRFYVTYFEDVVCDMPFDFLKNGMPQEPLVARWIAPEFKDPDPAEFQLVDLAEIYRRVMGHLNVCSKEPVVRQYDHSVQGTNALSPYGGVRDDGPNDAAVLRPLLDKPYGLVIAHGMNPVLNRIDPFHGAIWTGVEALANLVAVGGRVTGGETWLIDNFIWPFPDEESLGALDRAIDACVVLMKRFGIPFISGKDSLSSTYRLGDFVLKIPPVLCISAFGRIPNVEKTVSGDFKTRGSRILLVGNPDFDGMGGSALYDVFGHIGKRAPRPDLADLPIIFGQVHQWIVEGRVRAVHDVSEGGIAAALAEMCFGGSMGAQLFLRSIGEGEPWRLLFNETPGCFLVEATDRDAAALEREHSWFVRRIGYTIPTKRIDISLGRYGTNALSPVSVRLKDLNESWQRPMKEVFGHD